MKTVFSSKRHHYTVRVSIFLIAVALITGMVGCVPPSPGPSLEIRTWYDLDDVRDNLAGNHILMNDLNSNSAGYEELASETANDGKGWEPIGTEGIGTEANPFTGNFDGQGYEIRDLFIDRPTEGGVGLFVNERGVIENVGMVNVDVTGNYYVGGLVGWNGIGTVSNSYSTGNVTGEVYVGGLVGYNAGTVSNSYSTGNVSGDVHVGGLMGGNLLGTVSNSYSTGSVTSNRWVGGLVGDNWGNVSNCYATGSVSGDEYVGGLVGGNDGTVSSSFWDTETSGQATSDGGTGKNTTEMQDIATFSGAGWDIIAVANPGIRNSSYI